MFFCFTWTLVFNFGTKWPESITRITRMVWQKTVFFKNWFFFDKNTFLFKCNWFNLSILKLKSIIFFESPQRSRGFIFPTPRKFFVGAINTEERDRLVWIGAINTEERDRLVWIEFFIGLYSWGDLRKKVISTQILNWKKNIF